MALFCKGKLSWPELVGVDGKIAVAIIEKENPLVNAIIIKPNQPVTPDFSCNRVRVLVDCKGIVLITPIVG
ncbi:hypothetical protein CDL12_18714 [Handroanthus impetiginosus]|uniref:Uncharacterized protein n=1 Tax=Handroanthus impetiginosus TaxID=429701 RepID=A0A2G9GTX2_9LAMI|nr:hypothetical protein CDL12_18714 [Handroanthus impetiginosus]